MKKILVFLIALFPSSVFAEYNFNNVDFQFAQVEVDILGADFDGPGYGISFSKEFGDEMFFGAGVSMIDLEYSDSSGDYEAEETDILIGVGKYFDAGDGIAVISASIARADAEFTWVGVGSVSDDDTGIILTAGYIMPANDQLDFIGSITRNELGDGSTSFSLTASYDMSEQIALYGIYGSGDDVDSLGVGLRVNFD